MKKFLILAAAVLVLGSLSCDTTSYITLNITNPDANPVSFHLVSFTSSIDTLTEIKDYANKTYQIEVNPNGDKVKATVMEDLFRQR